MLETAIILLGILAVSLIAQERIKVPLPITTITLVVGLSLFGIHPIDINDHSFDEILMMLLPLLILADVVHLKPNLVKKHWKSIFFTAGIAVTLSVIAGVLLRQYILPEYQIAIPLMIMLMTVVIATDPVTTGAIFSNYDLPEDLKFLAESESLFNDATAVIIFSLALFSFQNPDVSGLMLVETGIEKIALAVGIGLLVGFLSIIVLELVTEVMAEAAFIILASMLSFFLAEHFHAAGILAIVITGLAITTSIALKLKSSEITDETKIKHVPYKLLAKLKNLSITVENKKGIMDNIGFLALFANTLLFVSMASLINFELLIHYWKEILSVFIATAIIRGVVMGVFMKASNSTIHLRDISGDWWAILSAAGVKGGLSILLLHLIPDFNNKELFEAIIIGVILLSTFVYSITLTLIIKYRKEQINAVV